jgi:hypothetical protein
MKLTYLSLANGSLGLWEYWELTLGCSPKMIACIFFHSPMHIAFAHRNVLLHDLVPHLSSVLYEMHLPFNYPLSVYRSGSVREHVVRFWDQNKPREDEIGLHWFKQLGRLSITGMAKASNGSQLKFCLRTVQSPDTCDAIDSALALVLEKKTTEGSVETLLHEPLHVIRYERQIHAALCKFMDLMPDYWAKKGAFLSELDL